MATCPQYVIIPADVHALLTNVTSLGTVDYLRDTISALNFTLIILVPHLKNFVFL